MVIIGSVTALASACIALAQNDVKKVIAFSTCSQLGYLMLSCGLSAYSTAFFHLTTHAFFKALLFLTAGSIIHSLQGEQDIRRMGGLAYSLPIACLTLTLGGAALSGLPMLAGFFSKDFIIELALVTHTNNGLIAAFAAICTAFITAIYSSKLGGAVFFDVPNVPRGLALHIHEMDKVTLLAMFPLVVLTIFGGYLLRDIFVGVGALQFNETLFSNVRTAGMFAAAELLHKKFKLFVFVGVHYAFYNAMENQFEYNYTQYFDGLANKLFFDSLYMHNFALNIMLEVNRVAHETLQTLVQISENYFVSAANSIAFNYKGRTGTIFSLSLSILTVLFLTTFAC